MAAEIRVVTSHLLGVDPVRLGQGTRIHLNEEGVGLAPDVAASCGDATQSDDVACAVVRVE